MDTLFSITIEHQWLVVPWAIKPLHWIAPFESAEHQAKVFAAAFLIVDSVARYLPSAEEISAHCCVSLESATIYFTQRAEENSRSRHVEEIKRKADQFRARHAANPPTVRYLNEACTSCGARTIFPVGTKYMCQTCDRIFDGFQDGDSVE
jgi:hypothetical protein